MNETIHKETKEKLQQSEEHYRILAENSADIIWMMDMNQRFTYVSPSVQRHRGYTAEEAMALTLEETLPPSSLQKAREALAQALENARHVPPEQLRSTSLVIELENYCKDGSVIPVESNISFLLNADGRPTGFIGASRNISDRKHMEERLREAETEQRKLTRTVEQSSSAIVITDTEGTIEYVNPAFTCVTGYTAAEAIGQNPRILKSGHHPPEFYREMWRTLIRGDVWRGELVNKKKNGELYWESAVITPVKDQDGVTTHYLTIKNDITEQKKMERQVREQADLLAIVNDNIPAVLYQFFIQGNEYGTRYVSPQITTLFGVEWTDDPKERFMRFVAGIHPEDQMRFLLSVREAADNLTPWTFEGRFIKPLSGETIWFRGQAAPVAEDGGQVFNGVLLDITEQKQLEADRHAKHKQQQILNKLLQIGLEDLTLHEQMDRALTEIVSVPWLLLMPRGGIFLVENRPDTLALVARHNLAPALETMCALVPFGRCLCGRAAQTRQVQFADCVNDDHENRYDGMTAHGHYNIPILSDQELLGVIVLYLPAGHQRNEDEIAFLQSVARALAGIIKRKQAEENLRIRQRQAETLRAAAQALSSSLELTRVLELILDELYKVVPYDSVSVQQLQDNALTIIAGRGFAHPEKIVGLKFDITRNNPNHDVVRRRQPVIVHNPVERYSDFTTKHHAPDTIASWLGVPLLFQDRVIGMIAVNKVEAGFYNEEHGRLAQTFAAQAAIAIENARLFTEAKQATEVALQAKQAAEAASRTKSDFLSRVSHELRTPLGSILGYTELFKDGVYGPVTPQQVRTAEKVMASTHYLTNLVDELLDQAQMEAGRINLETIRFNLPEMIRRVHNKMDILAQKENLILLSEIDPDMPDTIVGDERRLQQILINLVNNAIKFTTSGTVKVSVYRPNEAQWAMQVSDTGPGIAAEAQAYIFDSFRQAENVATRKHAGFGLGLSIVKQLTAHMGGEVIVDSNLGKGSVFTVLLPLIIQKEAENE